jgi:hypothetical protein
MKPMKPMKTPNEAPPLAQEPAGGWPADEYTGKAGRYVRDPLTGLRRPAEPETETPTAEA